MEKRITDKIKELQNGNVSQEEFMKKLAEVDENSQLSDEAMSKLSGGGGMSPIEWFGYFVDEVKKILD